MSRLGPRRVAAPRGLRSAQLTNARSFGNIDRGRARGRSPPPLDTAGSWRADPPGRVRTVIPSSPHSPPTRRPVADAPLLPPLCELMAVRLFVVVGAPGFVGGYDALASGMIIVWPWPISQSFSYSAGGISSQAEWSLSLLYQDTHSAVPRSRPQHLATVPRG
jgi:hypothetical protein